MHGIPYVAILYTPISSTTQVHRQHLLMCLLPPQKWSTANELWNTKTDFITWLQVIKIFHKAGHGWRWHWKRLCLHFWYNSCKPDKPLWKHYQTDIIFYCFDLKQMGTEYIKEVIRLQKLAFRSWANHSWCTKMKAACFFTHQ